MGNKQDCERDNRDHKHRMSSSDSSKENDLNFLARVKRAEDARMEAIAAHKHDSTKENQQLLKKLFKRLDPTVSKVETDIQGDVQVSLKYDPVRSHLLVNVIKIRELGVNNISGKSAEPFVTLILFPDMENIGMKQTGPSSQPLNPSYNEKFVFPLEEVLLSETKLILQVLDQDIVNDEYEFLGEVIISLSDINFKESSVHTAWYTLQPEIDLSITGDLEISLSYALPQSLSVTVHQATNLKTNSQRGRSDPVVKIGIPGVDALYVTEVKLNDLNPRWDESFTFEVPQEQFSYRYVVLTVLDSGAEDDCLLGHVVIDLDNFDISAGYKGSFPLADMSHSDRLRNKWFQTTQVQEFREALWAHSYFNYPSMLFQNHTGSKIIRLTCQAAGGATAKLRLTNGIPTV